MTFYSMTTIQRGEGMCIQKKVIFTSQLLLQNIENKKITKQFFSPFYVVTQIHILPWHRVDMCFKHSYSILFYLLNKFCSYSKLEALITMCVYWNENHDEWQNYENCCFNIKLFEKRIFCDHWDGWNAFMMRVQHPLNKDNFLLKTGEDNRHVLETSGHSKLPEIGNWIFVPSSMNRIYWQSNHLFLWVLSLLHYPIDLFRRNSTQL